VTSVCRSKNTTFLSSVSVAHYFQHLMFAAQRLYLWNHYICWLSTGPIFLCQVRIRHTNTAMGYFNTRLYSKVSVLNSLDAEATGLNHSPHTSRSGLLTGGRPETREGPVCCCCCWGYMGLEQQFAYHQG
jgi:hypothetical protein